MMVTALALFALVSLQNQDVSVKFIDSGATAKVGGYRPMRAEMNGAPELVKKAPEGLAAPKYGTIKIEDKSWNFIVDEPEGKPAKLFVDTNGDGDLTNDPPAEWDAQKVGDLTMYKGTAKVDLGSGRIGSLGLYRFDPKDPQREMLKNTVLYFTDYGSEVTLNLDGKSFTSFVAGAFAPGMQLFIDRDGNGKRSVKLETAVVGKPFNFTGTTYLLGVKEGNLTLEKATETLPQAPLPPDLSIGKKALPFNSATLDGSQIEFPKTYAGKIVLIDFWATWCGPCRAELPNVKAAYNALHEKGFEVLGISFDRENMADKLKEFIGKEEMPWPQIYEGKYWDTTLGGMYDVSGIPFTLLVDGDSGEILGTSRELRGPGLTDFVQKALDKKKEASK
jgi:thiol-disulfide isomerase/thioredoxin